MGASAVFALFDQYDNIRSAIPVEDISNLADLDSQFRKLAVLSCASHLETDLMQTLKDFFFEVGPEIGEFVRRGALERKFHTLFSWDKPLPDSFFKSWGSGCEKRYKARLEADITCEDAMRSFMVLVSTRNLLVHENLAEKTSDLTFEEVREHFSKAYKFPALALDIIRP
jgi:GH35 family endo-1,4-beta-xylanase